MSTQPTQVRRPWRATARSVFQALVAFAAMWAVIVETIGLDPSWQWVAASLAVTGAITRIMALPQVEAFLKRFVPFLAAEPDRVLTMRIPTSSETTVARGKGNFTITSGVEPIEPADDGDDYGTTGGYTSGHK